MIKTPKIRFEAANSTHFGSESIVFLASYKSVVYVSFSFLLTMCICTQCITLFWVFFFELHDNNVDVLFEISHTRVLAVYLTPLDLSIPRLMMSLRSHS